MYFDETIPGDNADPTDSTAFDPRAGVNFAMDLTLTQPRTAARTDADCIACERITLAAGKIKTLTLRPGQRVKVRVHSGQLWLTAGDGKDYVISTGEQLRLESDTQALTFFGQAPPRLVVIEALSLADYSIKHNESITS